MKRDTIIRILALAAFALGVSASPALAYPRLDSSLFDHRYEADSALPQSEDLGSDWRESHAVTSTVSGGALHWTSSNSQVQYWESYVARGITGSDPFDDDIGYTAEIRCKILNGTGMYGALQIACSGSSDSGDYCVFQIDDYSLTWVDDASPWQVTTITAMPGSGDPLDNTEYHVYRIAFAADTQLFTVWRDGEVVWANRHGGYDWRLNPRLFFGDGSSTQSGGSSWIDYVRWDADGAYEPPSSAPVPEPAGLTLMGLVLVLRRRTRC